MRYFIILASILAFSSCEKLAILSGVINGEIPKCISEEIAAFKIEAYDTCDEGATVIKYLFQDEEVYVFTLGHCLSDGAQEVLNSDCEVICTLGTIVGITECQGEDFVTAEELKVIWKQEE